ncbi:MAG: hypothetical protein Q7J72_05275 [Candidatus Omnitrophota bacterium]|nr:hypothetical protein [Candidatus Omnitrophota bacterium]
MKKLTVLLLCLFCFGCEQKSIKPPSKLEDREAELLMKNSLNENIELLAVKYGVDTKTLEGVIGDYEELTQGISITRAMHNIADKTNEEKATTLKPQIVSIQVAIEAVSNKYQIPKEKVGNILIDNKMMMQYSGERDE